MSDNKEYVAQALESGSINISEDVLAATAAMAVVDVEGVCALGSTSGAKRGAGKGIRVTIAEDDTISVDCYVVVLYGHSVIEVAKAVQQAVAAGLESTTGRTVSGVNVNISGISNPRGSKK